MAVLVIICVVLLCALVYLIGWLADGNPKCVILIEGAMEEEIDELRAKLCGLQERVLGGWHYYEGKLEGYPVVICKTQIGFGNAAAATALGIQKYKPFCVFNIGTCGGYTETLKKGTLIIAERLVNLDAFVKARREIGEGLGTGEGRRLPIELSTGDFLELSTDQELTELAAQYLGEEAELGIVGSTSGWNNELDMISSLNETTGAVAEEMEGAAVAQVCAQMDVRFAEMRIVANNALLGEEYDPQMARIGQEAAERVVHAWIEELL